MRLHDDTSHTQKRIRPQHGWDSLSPGSHSDDSLRMSLAFQHTAGLTRSHGSSDTPMLYAAPQVGSESGDASETYPEPAMTAWCGSACSFLQARSCEYPCDKRGNSYFERRISVLHGTRHNRPTCVARRVGTLSMRDQNPHLSSSPMSRSRDTSGNRT